MSDFNLTPEQEAEAQSVRVRFGPFCLAGACLQQARLRRFRFHRLSTARAILKGSGLCSLVAA